MPMHMTSSSLAHPVLVRTSLPKKVDMETFKLSNKDVFFVLSPDTMEYIFEKDCILSQSILADLGLTLTPADPARLPTVVPPGRQALDERWADGGLV